MNNNSQNGNAIVLILIAVALFAALSLAFSNTSRTSSSFISDEEAKAYANQIIAYGNDVKSAVKRLRLRGCSDTDISFENSIESGYENPSSPTTCHVFDVAGGGLQWQEINPSMLDNSKSGETGYGQAFFPNTIQILGVGNDCATADCTDLMIDIPYIRLEICNAINDIFNINYTYTDESIVNFTYTDNRKFLGVYDFQTASVGSIIGDQPNSIGAGVKTGCYPRNVPSLGGQFYAFYTTLLSR